MAAQSSAAPFLDGVRAQRYRRVTDCRRRLARERPSHRRADQGRAQASDRRRRRALGRIRPGLQPNSCARSAATRRSGAGTRSAPEPAACSRCRSRSGAAGASARKPSGRTSRRTRSTSRPRCSRNLLYERLDEIGLDFAVIYPTGGLRVPRVDDDERRRAASRAYNIVTAEYFGRFADRMTPAAIIPMHTPDEAIEELEFVDQAARLQGGDARQPDGPAGRGRRQGRRRGGAFRGVPRRARRSTANTITIRSGRNASSCGSRRPSTAATPRRAAASSPSNFVYNHVGHFAAASHAACKAIFLGGVTRRFPELRLRVPRRRRRLGLPALRRPDRAIGNSAAPGAGAHVDPRNLDRALLLSLVEKYGYERIAAALRERGGRPDPRRRRHLTGGVAELDDYSACKITRKEDWRDLYVKPFYFGCEADDRIERLGLQPQGQPVRRQAQCDLQLGYRAFRRARHDRRPARGLRDGRAWPRH